MLLPEHKLRIHRIRKLRTAEVWVRGWFMLEHSCCGQATKHFLGRTGDVYYSALQVSGVLGSALFINLSIYMCPVCRQVKYQAIQSVLCWAAITTSIHVRRTCLHVSPFVSCVLSCVPSCLPSTVPSTAPSTILSCAPQHLSPLTPPPAQI